MFISAELAFPNEYMLLVAIAGSFIFISVLIFCVCGCRKETPKNDLLGLDGMVKITNPDENVNHLPSVGKYLSHSKDDSSITNSDEINKRPSGGTNPHRSLPDIPIYTDGDVPGSDNGVSGDTSSDLYATVEDKVTSSLTNSSSRSNRHTLPNGVHLQTSVSHHRTSSQTDSNYSLVKENPYDKVKKTENPYAQVQSGDVNDENSKENSPGTPHISNTRVNGPSVDPMTSSRSRRSSLQNSLVASGSNTVLPSSTVDIPAATAVAGRVAASQDLPYMTPPITLQADIALSQQQHFSGDSQDSSKGYTSISVREPLEHIINQPQTLRSRKADIDPHYATVSDDSDDNMYAAIVEPSSQIYNDGSETYAQIQPVTIVEVHGHSSNFDETDVPTPQLPNVNMKHVPHVHSRQASSSSCTSSVANIGSPKPEKRQANSPLPPTPAVSPDLYAKVDKNHSRENSRSSLPAMKNLEDMYAKVHKNKKKYDDEDKNNESSTSQVNISYTPDVNVLHQKINSRQSWSSKESFDESNKHFGETFDYSSDSDVSLDAKQLKRKPEEHCYETLSKNGKKSSLNKINDVNEIGYEKIRDRNWQLASSNAMSGPESFLSNDPGYEQLHLNCVSSDIDPNYEVLRPHRTSSLSDSNVGYSTITNDKSTLTVKSNYESVPNTVLMEDGYSVINKMRKSRNDPGYEEINNQIDEPNYESMPSECGNYATVHQKSTESESDPNYESVKYLDVNLSEPPYERLHDDENKGSESSEYELISNKQGSIGTPDYERIKDVGSKSSDNSDDRTISDNGKFSNGDEPGHAIDNLTPATSLVVHTSADVDINIIDVDEIIKNDDDHMYFQV